MGNDIDDEGYLLDKKGNRKYTVDDNGEKEYKEAGGDYDQQRKAAIYISKQIDNPHDFFTCDELSEKELQAYLLLNDPIVINYGRTADVDNEDGGVKLTNHAVVVVGYDLEERKYLVYDPWKEDSDSGEYYTYKQLNIRKEEEEGKTVTYDWASSVVFDENKEMKKYNLY